MNDDIEDKAQELGRMIEHELRTLKQEWKKAVKAQLKIEWETEKLVTEAKAKSKGLWQEFYALKKKYEGVYNFPDSTLSHDEVRTEMEDE